MTVAEVKELYKGEYVDLEVYNHFHGDNCVELSNCSPEGDYTEDMEVGLYELMDQSEYNNTLMANCDIYADFDDWYGNKNAKILCIMIK